MNLGGEKIFLILIIALVVLGPERLPEAARKMGSIIRQVKAMSAGFENEVRKAIDIDGLNPFASDPTTLGDTPFLPEQSHLDQPDPSTPATPALDAPPLTQSVPAILGEVPSPDTEPMAELESDIRARNVEDDATTAGEYPAAS